MPSPHVIIDFSMTRETGFSLLPPVKYVPAWFPGATFKRIAKRSSELSYYIRNQPWKDVLDRVRTRFWAPFMLPS